MPARLLVPAILVAISPTGALAQHLVSRNGSEVRLHVTHACDRPEAPNIRQLTNPMGGRVSIRLTTPSFGARCPNGEMPTSARGMFYKPDRGFRGTDIVGFEVIGPGGQTSRQTATIVVY